MKTALLGGLALAAMIGTGTALAQAAPPSAPGVQATSPYMPLPGLGAVQPHLRMKMAHPQARSDVQAHVQRMFAKLDANRDGFVTKAEAEAAHGKVMGEMRGKFANRWGEGGRPPLDRGAMFDRLDANHDGMISRQEYLAARPEIQERRVMVMRNGDGAIGTGAGMRMHAMGMGGRMFDMADANRDGRVTLQEMTAAALQHFDMADANHDGTLTPEERRQMHQRMRGEHRPG